MREEVDEQILSDGLHFERSPAYHCQVLGDLLGCYTVLKEGQFKEGLGTIIQKMGTALACVTHPDGLISLFNDGGLGMAYSPRELTEVLGRLLDFNPEKPTGIILDEAGYYGLQKGDSYLLFDAGKIAPDFLPAHGHGDIFSFEWTIGNQRIFIDKGVYEYNAGEKRRLSRSTLSHNTVNIAGKDQCEFWKSFRVAKRANVTVEKLNINSDYLKITATHDGYCRLDGSPVHRRSIEFDGTMLEITDTITYGTGQKAEARFLIHPSVEVKEKDECIF